MRLLFVSKRWHLWRYRAAKWLLSEVVIPMWTRLDKIVKAAGTAANAQHDKARMRLEVCKRCPLFSELSTCNACNCYMPAKVQIDTATCPQKRW